MKNIHREPIIVGRGYIKKLAEECKVSRNTVTHALNWGSDNYIQNKIRERAQKYIKKF